MIAFIDKGFTNNSAMVILHSELKKLLKAHYSFIYLDEDPNADYDYLFMDSIDSLFVFFSKFKGSPKIVNKIETKPVIQIKHDRRSHNPKWSNNYYKLLHNVNRNTIIFYHLSNYSKDLFKGKFRDATHICIMHPNYFDLQNNISKIDARKLLGIKKKPDVFLFFGTPRTYHEVVWLVKSFKKIKSNCKLLIANRNLIVGNIFQRQYLKIFFSLNKQIKFYNEKTKDDFLQNYLNAADFAFLPRFSASTLNSGLFFLYTSFKLPVIIPQNSVLFNVLKMYNVIPINNFEIKNKDEYLLKAEDNYKRISQNSFDPKNIALKIFNGISELY